MESDGKVLEKIRKLLNLGASPNEPEAVAAVNKAHALLREYNLSIEDIKEPVDVKRHDVIKGSRMLKWRKILIYASAYTNYCEVVETVGRGVHNFSLYGREHNVAGAMALYGYLAEVVGKAAEYARPGLNKSDFCLGMAFRLKERLEEMMVKEAAECTALVCVSTEAHKAAMDDCHPKISSHSVRLDARASMYGAMAADAVALNRQIRSEA